MFICILNVVPAETDISVKDWRRKLLKMAAESIAENYNSKHGNDSSVSSIDKEVKLLLQRQDWLENMKQVSYSTYINTNFIIQ